MDITFFTAYPASGYQWRGESHEPSVRVAVSRSGLTTHIGSYSIPADTCSCTFIDYGTQHYQHLISTRCTDHLFHLWREGSQYIAFAILYFSHKQWSHPDSLIGKCRICTYHLSHRNLTRTEAERDCRLNFFIAYAERVNQTCQSIRIQFTHQVCRNPVIWVCKSPFQSHHFTIMSFWSVFGWPRFSIFIN